MQYLSNEFRLPGSKPILSSNDINVLKNNVSDYAFEVEKGLDAVAEIFAGLMDGKIYPPKVMEIYHRLKGPMPTKQVIS